MHRFIELIEYQRNALGMTRDQLSAKSGVSKNTIRSWTDDHRQPSLQNIEAVLNALGYSLTVAKKIELSD